LVSCQIYLYLILKKEYRVLKLHTDIREACSEWDKIKLNDFLEINVLEVYYKMHPELKHLFFIDDNMRLYAHIFKLRFNKANNYLIKRSLAYIIVRFISFDILYLTNSFITNISSFISTKDIDLQKLLNIINFNYSIIVIPDFLFKKMRVVYNEYIKIEVEEEMIIDIRRDWKTFQGYIYDLRKKYRNNIKRIIRKTSILDSRELDSNELKVYASDIQQLFNQVITTSRFSGPDFNTESFSLLAGQGFMKVYGYFLKDKIVGFSSEIHQNKIMYSYYVGFDTSLNKSVPIYGRILIDHIKNSIKKGNKKLVLGRTANEYKSNFGATPVKSFVYLKIKNKFLAILLRPLLFKLNIRGWVKRSPFKKK